MARPRQSTPLQLAAGQADYVLNYLLAGRKIGRGDVREALDEMGREIETLEQTLAALRGVAGAVGAGPSVVRRGPGRPAVQPAAAEGKPARAGKRRRRKPILSPAVKASQVLQGQYLSLMGQIPKTRRAPFKKLAKANGREAAITAMRKALNK